MTPTDQDFWTSLTPADDAAGKEPAAAPGEDPRGDVQRRYQRFRQYNRQRLSSLRERLTASRRAAFDLVPLLVHQVMAGAPGGFTRERQASGIVNFEPSQGMREAAEYYFPDAAWRPGALLVRPAVRALLAVGSMGTVAQTARSDLDLWTIVDDDILGTPLESALLKRLAEIENWASDEGLEVHFFPVTADQVQRCDFGQLGGESCGSALKSMLKEEFYRTHLLLQGQAPLWWLTRPGADADESARTLDVLRSHRMLGAEDFLDLGAVTAIPSDEFLGACMWQMAKSLRRPFKSLLKMTLVARHLELDDPPLLCERLKERVLGTGKLDPLDLDPYFILVDTLVSEFDEAGDPRTASLLRQCFYLQLLAARSPLVLDGESRAWLARFAERWGWTPAQQVRLERYDRWKLEEIIRMGDQIERYMDGILDNLHDRLGEGADAAVQTADLELLERKIRMSRGKHPNQVRLMPTAYYPGDLVQQRLFFVQEDGLWTVQGAGGGETPLLTSAADLGEACAWCIVNGLFGKQTVVRADGTEVSTADLRRRLDRMSQVFGDIRPEEVPVEAFGGEPEPKEVFVEVLARPRPAAGMYGTQHLSEQWDMLEYGTGSECLVTGVDTWTVTSWGTVVRQPFRGADGIVRAVLMLLNQRRGNACLNVRFVPGEGIGEGQSAVNRISMLYNAALRALGHSDDHKDRLFVMRIEGANHVIGGNGSGFTVRGPLSDDELRELLSDVRAPDRWITVDPGCVRLSYLREVLERTPQGCEATFLLRDVPGAGVVLVTCARQVFWDTDDAREGAWLLSQCRATATGPDPTCLALGPDGRWSEAVPPEAPFEDPDVVVEGDLADVSTVRFRVKNIRAGVVASLHKAAIWLLSGWSPGRERRPRLVLGRTSAGQRTPTLLETMRFRRRLSDALERACTEVAERGRRTKGSKSSSQVAPG